MTKQAYQSIAGTNYKEAAALIIQLMVRDIGKGGGDQGRIQGPACTPPSLALPKAS
ncbi:hypothetical protein A2U01_0049079, partial [Trifolium medium]|nr:hypothetical protein [Trifolium medium]